MLSQVVHSMGPPTSRVLIILNLSNEAFTASACSTDVVAVSRSAKPHGTHHVSPVAEIDGSSLAKIIYLHFSENSVPYVGIFTMLQGPLVPYLAPYWRLPIFVPPILIWPPVPTQQQPLWFLDWIGARCRQLHPTCLCMGPWSLHPRR
jgi:hypothetical protein